MVLRECWLRLIEEQSQVVSDLLSQISVISREVNNEKEGISQYHLPKQEDKSQHFLSTISRNQWKFYLQTQEYLQKSLDFHQLCCQ